MEKDYLTLKRAPLTRPSREWKDDDYDVLADGACCRPHLQSQRRAGRIALDVDTNFPAIIKAARRRTAMLRRARPP